MNPLNPKSIIFEDEVSFSLSTCPFDSFGVYLSDISSLNPGQGYGTAFLEFLKSKAKEFKVNIYLVPEVTESGKLNQDSLESWYLRHGFAPFKNGLLKFEGKPLSLSGKFKIIDM